MSEKTKTEVVKPDSTASSVKEVVSPSADTDYIKAIQNLKAENESLRPLASQAEGLEAKNKQLLDALLNGKQIDSNTPGTTKEQAWKGFVEGGLNLKTVKDALAFRNAVIKEQNIDPSEYHGEGKSIVDGEKVAKVLQELVDRSPDNDTFMAMFGAVLKENQAAVMAEARRGRTGGRP